MAGGWLKRRRPAPSPHPAGETAGEEACDEGRVAIIAGRGALPGLLAEALPAAYCVAFEGTECALPEERVNRYRFEKLGAFFKGLHAEGVTRVVMAGGIERPHLDVKQLDMTALSLAPKIMKSLSSGGDDSLLRMVISLFEGQGFAVVGAHQLRPDLTAPAGVLAGPGLSRQGLADADRAREILRALAAADVGQGCVVAGGLCLGIETIQGTDALLRYVSETPERLRRGAGIFCKLPKQGQDLRVDMPAIGVQTLAAVAAAGLEGIVIAAGGTLLLEREALVAQADVLGLTIQVVEV